MTRDGLSDFLRSFSYKPGWSIAVDFNGPPFDAVRFTLSACVPDAHAPESALGRPTIVIVSQRAIPVMEVVDMDRTRLLHWMRSFIMDMEAHEFGEWFKADGVRPFDPHLGD